MKGGIRMRVVFFRMSFKDFAAHTSIQCKNVEAYRPSMKDRYGAIGDFYMRHL